MHLRPGGLAGHSAALIGSHDSCGTNRHDPWGVRHAPDLGYAEIEGSEPSPGISTRLSPRKAAAFAVSGTRSEFPRHADVHPDEQPVALAVFQGPAPAGVELVALAVLVPG